MTKIDNRPLYFPKDFKKDKNDIWIQQKFNLDHSSLEGDTPLCLRKTHQVRLFNSLDFASLLRFWISTNWMKEQFVRTKTTHKFTPRILDLGCANLQAYHIWHNNGNYFGWPSIKYYGVDVNYKRLMVGKDLFKFKRSDQVTLIQANLEHPIIFQEEEKTIKFDFIVCMEFLEHIPKESFSTIMETIKKYQLKKDGRAILSSPNPNKEK